MWKINDLFLRQENRHKQADAYDNLVNDLDTRKEIFSTNWDDVYHFICLNPMAATFEWSDMVEKATKDEQDGLDFTKSVHIWKAMAHSHWRCEIRHKYVATLEKKIKNAYFMDHCLKKTKYVDLDGWYTSFSVPDTLEKRFCQ